MDGRQFGDDCCDRLSFLCGKSGRIECARRPGRFGDDGVLETVIEVAAAMNNVGAFARMLANEQLKLELWFTSIHDQQTDFSGRMGYFFYKEVYEHVGQTIMSIHEENERVIGSHGLKMPFHVKSKW